MDTIKKEMWEQLKEGVDALEEDGEWLIEKEPRTGQEPAGGDGEGLRGGRGVGHHHIGKIYCISCP